MQELIAVASLMLILALAGLNDRPEGPNAATGCAASLPLVGMSC